MNWTIPPRPDFILKRLHEAGHQAGLVGGCLRSLLLGQTPKDYDIATSATPEEVRSVFRDRPIHGAGETFGTLIVLHQGEPFEITTFRTEGAYTDHRHPDHLAFGRDLLEDLKRRDFTINGLYYDADQGLVDPFGGRKDLSQGILRAIGDPMERFQEDPLRILRALRFAALLGFRIEGKTHQALLDLYPLLDHLSKERIAGELVQILTAPGSASILKAYAPLFRHLLPELMGPPPWLKEDFQDPILRLASFFRSIQDPANQGNALLDRLRLSSSKDLPRPRMKHLRLLLTHTKTPLGNTLEERLDLYQTLNWNRPLLKDLYYLQEEPLPSFLEEGEMSAFPLTGEDFLERGIAKKKIGTLRNHLYREVLKKTLPNQREDLLSALEAYRRRKPK